MLRSGGLHNSIDRRCVGHILSLSSLAVSLLKREREGGEKWAKDY